MYIFVSFIEYLCFGIDNGIEMILKMCIDCRAATISR